MRKTLLRTRYAAAMLALLLLGYGLGAIPAAARPKCLGLRATKVGTARNDVMMGTRRRDVMVGLKGNDKIKSVGNPDRVYGGPGNDRLDGGSGADQLLGEAGKDTLLGGAAKDILKGGSSTDTLLGGGGSDVVNGGGGNDAVNGGGGNDVLIGGSGTDVLNGGAGTDNCSGGETYISCENIPVSNPLTIGDQSSIDVAVTAMAPGDTSKRVIDLVNQSSTNLTSIALTTTPALSSLLDSDEVNGLQMTVTRCSVAWSESGPPLDYTCSGTETTVVAFRLVIGSSLPLPASPALTAGQTDHLLVTMTLPTSAGNAFQGAESSITFTFVSA